MPRIRRGEAQHVPLKRAKNRRSSSGMTHSSDTNTIAQENRERDESREPEQHDQGLSRKDRELVSGARKTGGCEGQVDEREQGPDAGEDEPIDLAGRDAVPVSGPPVGDWQGCVSFLFILVRTEYFAFLCALGVKNVP